MIFELKGFTLSPKNIQSEALLYSLILNTATKLFQFIGMLLCAHYAGVNLESLGFVYLTSF